MFESQMMNSIAVLGSILESKKRNQQLPVSDETFIRFGQPEMSPIRSQANPVADLRTLSVFQSNPGKLAANTKCVENC